MSINILLIESDDYAIQVFEQNFNANGIHCSFIDPMDDMLFEEDVNRYFDIIFIGQHEDKDYFNVSEMILELRAAGYAGGIVPLLNEENEFEILELMEAGASDVVIRPPEVNDVAQKIQTIYHPLAPAMVENPTNPEIAPEIVDVVPVYLKAGTNKLIDGDLEVDVTRLEKRILQVLMTSGSLVVSPESMAQEVYKNKVADYKNHNDISKLHQILYHLRKKLKNIGSSVSIQNVRGIGYKIQYG